MSGIDLDDLATVGVSVGGDGNSAERATSSACGGVSDGKCVGNGNSFAVCDSVNACGGCGVGCDTLDNGVGANDNDGNAVGCDVELNGIDFDEKASSTVCRGSAVGNTVDCGVELTNNIDDAVNDELAQILSFARQRYIPVMLDDARALLYKTVKAAQPKRILEIGTAVGYSGIIMLMASSHATLNTMEMDEGLAALAKQNFVKADVYDRVNIFVGDARQIVLQLTGEYDLIFLDGPKGQYETFLPYLTDVLAVGGTLVCDNVLYKGLVENIPDDKRHKHITVARNMRAFLDDITHNPKFSTTLYRIGDGVTVSKKLC